MSDRISEVRITAGNHPVSDRLLRAADRMNDVALALYDAVMRARIEGRALDVDAVALLSEALRMVEGDVRGHVVPMARAIEDAAKGAAGKVG